MARLGPSKNTSCERKVRMMLVSAGVRFTLHPEIPGQPRRSADILVGDTYVFVHGRFWHDPDAGTRRMSKFWRDKVARNYERDVETLFHLRQIGKRTIIVWDDWLTPRNMWRARAALAPVLGRFSASSAAGRSSRRHTGRPGR